jgi:hypothetical protein
VTRCCQSCDKVSDRLAFSSSRRSVRWKPRRSACPLHSILSERLGLTLALERERANYTESRAGFSVIFIDRTMERHRGLISEPGVYMIRLTRSCVIGRNQKEEKQIHQVRTQTYYIQVRQRLGDTCVGSGIILLLSVQQGSVQIRSA